MSARTTHRGRRTDGGQAIVEYAIILPIQVMFLLSFIQLSLIFVAQHVVNYAAFCAARAQLVGSDAHKAAALACLKITGFAGVDPGNIDIPGWGQVNGYNAALIKTAVDTRTDSPPTRVTATVTHMYQLNVPVANELAYSIGGVLFGYPDTDRSYDDHPHIPVTASCTLARPWSVSEAQP